MVRPFVRSATLNGYVDVARSAGLDPVALMREQELDPADLSVPDRWISAPAVARLLDASAAASKRPDFALGLAALRRLTTLGPLSVVLREEPELRSVLTLLMRHEHSYNEALRMRLSESEGIATMALWFEFGEPAPADQALMLGVGALFGIIRECVGPDWRPLAVCFTTPAPDDLAPLHGFFGPGLRFGHEFTGLVFYASDLDARNALADPLMQPYAQRILDSVVTARARTTSDRVRELVELLLPLGRCGIDQVARSLQVDPRTLQRHLAAEGTSFSAILHAARAGLAQRHLSSDRYTVGEVATVLGFTSASAFSRWFHQQFGVSPREWRRTTRAPSPREAESREHRRAR
jgi:AraC-like DNA-binding protein